jgi:hypothetical protein
MQDSTVNPADLAMVRAYEDRRRRDYEFFQFVVGMLAEAARPVWEQGDGYGGMVRQTIDEVFRDAGLPDEPPLKSAPNRRRISYALRTEVYERDLYRCVKCGTHRDLSLDHILPWSKGGADTAANLQTLCRSCNSSKGVS